MIDNISKITQELNELKENQLKELEDQGIERLKELLDFNVSTIQEFYDFKLVVIYFEKIKFLINRNVIFTDEIFI